jgi:hypothetical protein
MVRACLWLCRTNSTHPVKAAEMVVDGVGLV